MRNHIAVDIGASSGRLVWGTVVDERIRLQEIHRFRNGFMEKDGHCYWDIDYLFGEVIVGLQKAKAVGIEDCTLGIDTWAVDYVLLDETGRRLHEVYAYRDERTSSAIEAVTAKVSARTLYEKTGIQFQRFNTLFQLSVHDRAQLRQAASILLVPDYLHYRLTGSLLNEVTNASTTQLLNVQTKDYDEDLLALLGLTRSQFSPLVEPGTFVGMIDEQLRATHGLPVCEVICVATHDTASAVLGIPAQYGVHCAYLSSGTWSLLGVEESEAITNVLAQEANFTNEWGAYGTFRFLKNIMGLWLIQEVQRNYDGVYSFADFVAAAEQEEPFRTFVNFDDERFLNPSSMVEEIRSYCLETGQQAPQTYGQIARVIFDNLAILYALSVEGMEAITGKTIEVIHIVGGGAHNDLLCQLTATVANKRVTAGPTESTALGNLTVQMIESGEVADIHAARQLIRSSFDVKEFVPEDAAARNDWMKAFRHHTARA